MQFVFSLAYNGLAANGLRNALFWRAICTILAVKIVCFVVQYGAYRVAPFAERLLRFAFVRFFLICERLWKRNSILMPKELFGTNILIIFAVQIIYSFI